MSFSVIGKQCETTLVLYTSLVSRREGLGRLLRLSATLGKEISRPLVGQIELSKLERLESVVLQRNYFSQLRKVPVFKNREEMWKSVFYELKDQPIELLEFGVWQGYSIKTFATLNNEQLSKFSGFDSFEGLPSDWMPGYSKGHFSENGNMPEVNDNRVKFIKGWYQNTLPKFLLNNNLGQNLIVHFDSDLYSSTLFVLTELERLKIPYIAIFDEFWNHEHQTINGWINGMEIGDFTLDGYQSHPTIKAPLSN